MVATARPPASAPLVVVVVVAAAIIGVGVSIAGKPFPCHTGVEKLLPLVAGAPSINGVGAMGWQKMLGSPKKSDALILLVGHLLGAATGPCGLIKLLL
jgi:hypothetical protein